ncbi:MAG: ABC transporter ATP-binding protein [Coriobacteriales bacterium]
MLALSGLGKAYGAFSLSGVGFAVPAGCILGLVGANGAGKTTTIRCLLGAARPQSGSIRLLGEETAPCAPGYVGEQRCAELRQDVGYVPDTCAFPAEATVREVGSICKRVFTSWDAAAYASACREAGLAEDKKVQELSRGMGMRLSLACALAHSPRLLVLDEATAGLDPLAREETLQLLRDYVARADAGILMSSHITSDLERIADRIVCLSEGRMVFDKDTADITDLAGVARCREAELQAIAAAGIFEPGTLRVRREEFYTELLVPDRFALAQAFPQVSVERASLDAYLNLLLKGAQL